MGFVPKTVDNHPEQLVLGLEYQFYRPKNKFQEPKFVTGKVIYWGSIGQKKC